MKKLFFYLLKKYSRTEKQRWAILEKLDVSIYNEYNEQTTFGNVYNFFIEFIMSNEFIKGRVLKNDKESLTILKRGITNTFDDAINQIKNETIFKDGKNKKR